MVDQFAATDTRLEQTGNLPILQRGFRHETQRSIGKPLEGLTLGDDGWSTALARDPRLGADLQVVPLT